MPNTVHGTRYLPRPVPPDTGPPEPSGKGAVGGMAGPGSLLAMATRGLFGALKVLEISLLACWRLLHVSPLSPRK